MKPMYLLPPAVLVPCFALLLGFHSTKGETRMQTDASIGADNKNIQYTGRIDFTDPQKPRFWNPGVYLRARFTGASCDAVIDDEVLWGKSHNYVEIAVDDRKPFRTQLTAAHNVVRIAEGLSDGPHTVTICKDTEAGIGYLEFLGFRCKGLLPLPPKPARKLEFIGDSITCGAGSDLSGHPCGQGEWYDQHNAYMSYGPITARSLKAQWHITGVAGIGLIHSCCDMGITMPQVFDKMDVRDNKGEWDFKRYQPDVVTICLGQNDGVQDATVFCDRYVEFIHEIRGRYPKAEIACLTSPMGDATLTAALKEYLNRVEDRLHREGDARVHTFFFSRSWNRGCGGHPDLDDHQLIAKELTTYLKKQMAW